MQEIPASFTAKHGWPGQDPQCALVTVKNWTKTEWPLQLHRVDKPSTGVSAVSVGTGWYKFQQDHGLSWGAFLTFEVVDDRCLVVTIHRRGAPAEYLPPQQPVPDVQAVDAAAAATIPPSERPMLNSVPPVVSDVTRFVPHEGEDSNLAPPRPLPEVPEVDNSDGVGSRRRKPPQVRRQERPHFTKTLKLSHTKTGESSRLVSTIPLFLHIVSPASELLLLSFLDVSHSPSAWVKSMPKWYVITYIALVGGAAGCPDCFLAYPWRGLV